VIPLRRGGTTNQLKKIFRRTQGPIPVSRKKDMARPPIPLKNRSEISLFFLAIEGGWGRRCGRRGQRGRKAIPGVERKCENHARGGGML